MVAFVASDEASFMNGAIIWVDGGALAGLPENAALELAQEASRGARQRARGGAGGARRGAERRQATARRPPTRRRAGTATDEAPADEAPNDGLTSAPKD